MSFDFDTFAVKAIDVFETISGMPVIWSHQNAPRPSDDFVTLQILNFTPVGEPEEVQGSGADHRVREWNTMTLQVKAIGSLASRTAFSMRRALHLRTYLDELATVDAGLATISQVNHVPIVRENGWEDQAVFDVIFNVPTEDVETVGYIGKVTGLGTIGSNEVSISVEE